ncbi:LysR family transcriptional regulator [Paraburkholderia sp.]|uniref:LysR family transcriptional regulator n=1 Tax=Paraburkholderia sp. TaxID=1926495 RepID=UPI003C7C167B
MSAVRWSQLSLSRKLRFYQFMVFERALDTGSLQRAANELALTQPAISKIIHELEQYFGGALLERSSRGVQPTELGALLGRRVKSMLADFQHMTDEVNAFKGGTSGHVVVGTSVSASAKLLPFALIALKARVPDVLVTIREDHIERLFSALAAGEIDIAMGRLPAQSLSNAFALRHEVLFDETLCLVGGARHWADRVNAGSRIDPSALTGVSWILPVPESPSRVAVDNYIRRSGQPIPRDAIESTSILANITLMMETPRVCLMSRSTVREFVDADLLCILDSDPVGGLGAVGFAVRADKELKPACAMFIGCLREVAATSERARITEAT